MNGALERVKEADTEVVAVALGDLRVGTGNAQCGDTGLFKGIGTGDRNVGAVSTENDGYALRNELGGSGCSLIGGRLVIGYDELDLIGLAADLNGGILSICILHAENLLLAACAVLTGYGLKDADLDDLIAAAVAAVAACAQRKYHEHRKN